MRIALVTGTREPVMSDHVIEKIRLVVDWADLVIVGDCATGVDSVTRERCTATGTAREVFVADWDTHGKGAGPRRNQAMVMRVVELDRGRSNAKCFAFPAKGSRGTWDCLHQAAAAGIPGSVVPL